MLRAESREQTEKRAAIAMACQEQRAEIREQLPPCPVESREQRLVRAENS